MTHITDRHHLARITQQLIGAAIDLQEAWLEEDQAAYAPRSNADTSRGTATPDPTSSIAQLDRKTADRDRLGRILLKATETITDTLEARKPHTPTKPCHCCRTELATHGPLCWACNRYLHRMGYPCTADIHDARPTIRMCECTDGCCDPCCTNRAAEGRRLCDTCRTRKDRRARADRDAHGE